MDWSCQNQEDMRNYRQIYNFKHSSEAIAEESLV